MVLRAIAVFRAARYFSGGDHHKNLVWDLTVYVDIPASPTVNISAVRDHPIDIQAIKFATIRSYSWVFSLYGEFDHAINGNNHSYLLPTVLFYEIWLYYGNGAFIPSPDIQRYIIAIIIE